MPFCFNDDAVEEEAPAQDISEAPAEENSQESAQESSSSSSSESFVTKAKQIIKRILVALKARAKKLLYKFREKANI